MRRLDDLLGPWRLRRRIADLLQGETGRLIGHARWRAGAGGAVQTESGTLRLAGRPPMTATRTYLWSETPRALVVHFADGRAFHTLDAACTTPAAEHRCGDDLYEVRYDFRRWPRWRSVWRVSGPRKRLVIVSAFAPLARPAPTRQNGRDAATE